LNYVCAPWSLVLPVYNATGGTRFLLKRRANLNYAVTIIRPAQLVAIFDLFAEFAAPNRTLETGINYLVAIKVVLPDKDVSAK
jgi:hypothetical protein